MVDVGKHEPGEESSTLVSFGLHVWKQEADGDFKQVPKLRYAIEDSKFDSFASKLLVLRI